jgi:hypothetical protein
MKARQLANERHVFPDGVSFAEIVIWELPEPIADSVHSYKYRLAFIVNELCVLRYDNERGKGDHRHFGDIEIAYRFQNIDRLLIDFQKDIERWQNEHG